MSDLNWVVRKNRRRLTRSNFTIRRSSENTKSGIEKAGVADVTAFFLKSRGVKKIQVPYNFNLGWLMLYVNGESEIESKGRTLL